MNKKSNALKATYIDGQGNRDTTHRIQDGYGGKCHDATHQGPPPLSPQTATMCTPTKMTGRRLVGRSSSVQARMNASCAVGVHLLLCIQRLSNVRCGSVCVGSQPRALRPLPRSKLGLCVRVCVWPTQSVRPHRRLLVCGHGGYVMDMMALTIRHDEMLAFGYGILITTPYSGMNPVTGCATRTARAAHA